LGVIRLRQFNQALLGKCCRRSLVNRGGVWYRVLVARYGEEDGRMEDMSRSGSTWWKEVVKIRDGIGGGGDGWFEGCVARHVGDWADVILARPVVW